MSLEEMRQQSEESEQQSLEEVQPEQSQIEIDQPENEPTEEEGGEFDFELDGEPEQQAKPTPEEALVYKLTKEKKKRQAAQHEAESKQSEIDQLRERLSKLENQTTEVQQNPEPTQSFAPPSFPQMYENGIDTKEAHDKAVMKWYDDMKAYEQNQEAQKSQQVQYQELVEAQAKNLGKDVQRFVGETNADTDKVIDMISGIQEEIDAKTGIPGAGLYLADVIGERSTEALLAVSRKPSVKNRLFELLQQDPNGGKAIAYLSEIKHQAKYKQTKISNAPDPDEVLSGDSSESQSQSSLQKEYDKANTWEEIQAVKAKAKKLGVKLS